jgi:hypothetical protein
MSAGAMRGARLCPAQRDQSQPLPQHGAVEKFEGVWMFGHCCAWSATQPRSGRILKNLDRMKLNASSLALFAICACSAQPYFVAPAGDDANPGTLKRPFATVQHAQQATRQKHGEVFLRGGTYYLSAPLVFPTENSGTKDALVVFENYRDEQPVLSGGFRLKNLDWQPYPNGIVQAQVPADLQTEGIFVNGERQILAHYPNPVGGYYHALHPALWGDFTWRIGGFSSAPNTKPPAELVPDPAAARKQLKLLYLSCGNKDGLISVSQGVQTYLQQQNIPHIGNVDDPTHDRETWASNLYHFAQRIFR